MIQHFDRRQNREVREKCFGEDLFVMMHGVLRNEYEAGRTSYTPFEIWAAASQFSRQLLGLSFPEEQADYLVEELQDECDRSEDVYYVLLAVSFQIGAYRKQRDDIDRLEAMLMPRLRSNAEYLEHMSVIGQKELRMACRIDLLEYELKEIIAEGGTSEEVAEFLELFVMGSSNTSTEAIEHNLLLLNYVNLELDHSLDVYVKRMFEQLGYGGRRMPQVEITMGNKNVATEGGVQMNAPMPANDRSLEQLISSIKSLKDGRK